MMKKTTLITLVCLGTIAGCHRKAKPELTEVPPPMEPVQVQPYQAEPVQPQAVTWDAPAPVSSAPVAVPSQTTYTIQKGDSLWKIAERHYGNGQRWQDIVAANPGLVPEKLPVGKTIVLP